MHAPNHHRLSGLKKYGRPRVIVCMLIWCCAKEFELRLGDNSSFEGLAYFPSVLDLAVAMLREL